MLTEIKIDLDRMIPNLAKDEIELSKIREEISHLKTTQKIYIGDSRNLEMIEENSVHLILTSPPYWNLKRYNDSDGQLGHIQEYRTFLEELDKVWIECYKKLTIGGRLVIVVGDVLQSRREHGRHKVVPLHADIQVRCEKIGYDNLAPIIWHKISNAKFEVVGNSKFLGKPYEPNGIIKNDIEYILMFRKNGGYRKPTYDQRRLSIISETEFNKWYQQIWDFNGASTKTHPAPYPEELSNRIIRMFSFVSDTVLDPFFGSGTTMISAIRNGRNCIGIELDHDYSDLAFNRINNCFGQLFDRNFNLQKIDLSNGETSTTKL